MCGMVTTMVAAPVLVPALLIADAIPPRKRVRTEGIEALARIDDEITVKLLRIGKDRIRLLPRNPDYAPIDVLPDQDFAIEGLYCGLVRPNR